jgi:hypothetical protein
MSTVRSLVWSSAVHLLAKVQSLLVAFFYFLNNCLKKRVALNLLMSIILKDLFVLLVERIFRFNASLIWKMLVMRPLRNRIERK